MMEIPVPKKYQTQYKVGRFGLDGKRGHDGPNCRLIETC